MRILTHNECRPPSTWACQVIAFPYMRKEKVNYVTQFSFLLLKGEWMRLISGTYYDSLSTLVIIFEMNLE